VPWALLALVVAVRARTLAKTTQSHLFETKYEEAIDRPAEWLPF